jgi:hypothetical protein
MAVQEVAMSLRSVLMIVVLVAIIGRVRRRTHLQRLRHQPSSLLQRGDGAERELDRLGHPASTGKTPQPA